VKFWVVAGSEVIGKRGILTNVAGGEGIVRMQTMLSIAFSAVSCSYCRSVLAFSDVIHKTLSNICSPRVV